jgi:hypothetical protein
MSMFNVNRSLLLLNRSISRSLLTRRYHHARTQSLRPWRGMAMLTGFVCSLMLTGFVCSLIGFVCSLRGLFLDLF